jgi:hypothetical protein
LFLSPKFDVAFRAIDREGARFIPNSFEVFSARYLARLSRASEDRNQARASARKELPRAMDSASRQHPGETVSDDERNEAIRKIKAAPATRQSTANIWNAVLE